ncbi:hypothetical protein E2562_012362, partial [Oryza meyeriana var. granulata]
PMVTHLAKWAKATDDCYEETLLELSEQQGCLGDLEVDLSTSHHPPVARGGALVPRSED